VEEMSEQELKEVGKVTHYFTRIGVAVVNLTDTLSVGDRILIRGSSTNFEQTVESMQIEHKNVNVAYSGQSIGLKVNQRVREGDRVYKIL
jgi:putative protease